MTELGPRKKRLLVIDDDDGLREIFRFSMQKEGFVVEEAVDGVTGLQQAQEFEPDLIVVDLMMPNLNGFEVIQNLQVLGLGKIPVVVISGYSEQSSEETLRQSRNVVEFLKKPINYSSLAGLIRARLEKRA